MLASHKRERRNTGSITVQSLENRPRFIVDVNAGRLAKWLRILGYDTAFINPIKDGELLEIAGREGRIVLTRDHGLARRRAVTRGLITVMVPASDLWQEQLREVAARFQLTAAQDSGICARCNERLLPVALDYAKERVPPYVAATQQQFATCPRCNRIYWQGTHWEQMQRVLDSLPGQPRVAAFVVEAPFMGVH